MSNTVAIVAITSGATLSAAGITAYASHASMRVRTRADREQMQARRRHERSLHDVDELRNILDEGAETIRRVRDTVARPEGPRWVEEGLTALEPLHSKLAIRLGQEEALTRAVRDLLGLLQTIKEHYELNAPRIKSEEAEDVFWHRLEMLRTEVGIYANRFLVEAHQAAGARLTLSEDR
jgi:hypothetical protein